MQTSIEQLPLSRSHVPLVTPEGVRDIVLPLPEQMLRQLVLVPSTLVTVFPVRLPLRRESRRMQALPFAIEERLAQPLEEIHAALGPSLGGDMYLCAVLDRVAMAELVKQAEAGGFGARRMVPVASLLPRPEAGNWTVLDVEDGKLVRLPDGTSLEADLSAFAALHEHGGRPELNDMSAGWTPPPLSDLIDLRSGAFARRADASQTFVKIGLGALAASFLLQALIGVADIAALNGIADDREARFVTAYRDTFPQTPPGTELMSDLDARVSSTMGGQSDQFLAVLSAIGGSIEPDAGVTFTDLRFDAATGEMVITAEAASLESLNLVAARLSATGLDAALGTARAVPGGAVGEYSILSRGGAG